MTAVGQANTKKNNEGQADRWHCFPKVVLKSQEFGLFYTSSFKKLVNPLCFQVHSLWIVSSLINIVIFQKGAC